MNIGKIIYYTHSSKTKCVFVDNKDLPLICIDIWCKAGSSFEDKEKKGTAHFLEHMIFKGSNKIMPGEFDQKIESLGGISNASTGYDDAHYYVLIPPNNFSESLALLTNIVLTPKISINEFNIEKSVVIDEIKQQNDQPDEKLFNYFLNRVWLSDNYGNSILGTEKNILSLNKSDLETFHQKRYTSENICIAIAGNITNEIYNSFKQSNIKYFEHRKANLIPYKEKESSVILRTGREEITFENIEFSRIYMAWGIPSQKNQKITTGFEILASLMSVGRRSRLVESLKEEKNLVESIYADINVGELGGLFIIEACCYDKYLKRVEKEINLVIDEMLEKKISKIEIRKAINIVKSNYIFNLETSTQLSSFYGNELLWGRKSSLEDLDIYLEYWANLDNFIEILNYLSRDKFTFIASSKK